jgi:hypothetical protein
VGLPRIEQPFVVGTVHTPVGMVPRVAGELKPHDLWGSFKVRWGVKRMDYTVDPGLYAIGGPDSESPVLVTANYKLTFDRVRKALAGRSVWLLVLDTNGINVWCAAGKGTYGTEELVRRIESSGLADVVTHRKLLLPQLGAPGVSAHEVKKQSGFRVKYGPIRSEDIGNFMDTGFKATADMRRKTFDTWERVVLIPVELVGALKVAAIIMPIFFLLGGLGGPGTFWSNAMDFGLFAAISVIVATVAGAVLTPILLPWLPGRAFSAKGLIPGLVAAQILLLFRIYAWSPEPSLLESLSWLILVPAAATYLAMNFTGASTYTSLSGVRKEMRFAVPAQIAAGVIGVVLWLGSRFTS